HSSGQGRQALGSDRDAASLAPAVGTGAKALLSLLHRDRLPAGSASNAAIWARSNAVVDPSGSCSSSVAALAAASTTPRLSAATVCSAPARAAAISGRARRATLPRPTPGSQLPTLSLARAGSPRQEPVAARSVHADAGVGHAAAVDRISLANRSDRVCQGRSF